jgi:hypothetical protein
MFSSVLPYYSSNYTLDRTGFNNLLGFYWEFGGVELYLTLKNFISPKARMMSLFITQLPFIPFHMYCCVLQN